MDWNNAIAIGYLKRAIKDFNMIARDSGYSHFIKSADAAAAEALDNLVIGLQNKNIPTKKKA